LEIIASSLAFNSRWMYNITMKITVKNLKPRNFVAMDLRTPKYRKRVETSKKAYKRTNQREIKEMAYA
jgi:hypothetical protein